MKCLSSLVLAVLLSVDTGVPAVTPSLAPPVTLGAGCEQTSDTAKPQDVEKTTIPATVIGVDGAHGVLNLETEVGRAQVAAPPEALRDFHVGDQVALCTVDEEPSQNLLQDAIIT